MGVGLQFQRQPTRRSLAGSKAVRAARCLPHAHPTSSTESAPSYCKLCRSDGAQTRTNPPGCQALISRTWSFDARESCGQIGAAAVSVRSALPGLLLTTLPPSAAAGKGTDLRPGGSGSLLLPRESPRRCCLGRCFPTTALCHRPDNSE